MSWGDQECKVSDEVSAPVVIELESPKVRHPVQEVSLRQGQQGVAREVNCHLRELEGRRRRGQEE